MRPVIVELRGRELEPAVALLLGQAQIHRPAAEAEARGPSIALEYAASERLRLWGCELDGVVGGVAGVEPLGPGSLVLRDLAVATGLQANGIGRTLIDHVQRLATHIEGDTLAPATGFYERCGFVVAPDGTMPDGETRFRFTWHAGDTDGTTTQVASKSGK